MRRSVWIAAGSAAVLIGAGLVGVAVLEAGAADTPRTADSSDSSDSAIGEHDPGATAPAEPGAEPSDTVASTLEADRLVLAGADPVAATLTLLRMRSACLAAVSESCLAGVDQPDSAALDADLVTIRAGTEDSVDDPVPTPGPDPPSFVGRWGDSALIDVVASTSAAGSGSGAASGSGSGAVSGSGSGSASGSGSEAASGATTSLTISLLLVTGEEGWRIRDLTVG